MTADLHQLQRDAYGNACVKGWHERPLRDAGVVDHDRVLAKLALVHSEISEAWIAVQERDVPLRIDDSTGKPEGFVVEIADAVIRILDLCGALGVAVSNYVAAGWPAVDCRTFLGFSDELHRARYLLDQATEAARVDDWRAFGCRLGETLTKLAQLCVMVKVDLVEAIAVKMAYNTTRPHRHGGKKA